MDFATCGQQLGVIGEQFQSFVDQQECPLRCIEFAAEDSDGEVVEDCGIFSGGDETALFEPVACLFVALVQDRMSPKLIQDFRGLFLAARNCRMSCSATSETG